MRRRLQPASARTVSPRTPDRRTTIFTKRPQPGRVKTRLTPPLTAAQASSLAQAMLDDTVARHMARREYTTTIAVADADNIDWVRMRYPGVLEVEAQEGDGLGQRMANWFAKHCNGVGSVVLVGSDCPLLASESILSAHLALEGADDEEQADVVFAPDAGGGYCLVGMCRALPELFTEITMSTEAMFDETVALARRMELRVRLLSRHYDVDFESDVQQLGSDLRRRVDRVTGAPAQDDREFPTRTYAALQTLPPTLQ